MIVQLGKFGDCINILPFAYMKSKQHGEPTNWLIGKQWASILDGVSYVNPTIWPDSDDTLHRALATLEGKKQWVTQAWLNPDPFRETDSFAKEQWRYAGALNERGKWPLVFDKRDAEREKKLLYALDATKRNKPDAPVILLATTSVSTSYRHVKRLMEELEKLNATVIILDELWVTHIFDFIALYDAADLLITVDTCHLHLARASQCPVIALVNDGWKGAVPPPQAIAAWRYSELGDDLTPVVAAARNQLGRKVDSMAYVCDSHDIDSERLQQAIKTHPRGMMYCRYGRRPTTKEMLGLGLDAGKDAVIFTHDDVTFLPDTLGRIKAHLQKFNFGCSRRHAGHIGREIFWFRSDWLRKHWEEMPNPYWSVQKPDLILARWLRHLKGIPTTMENLNYDFPPVELPDVIYHEDHKSNWDNPEVEGSMEGLHNEAIWSAGV